MMEGKERNDGGRKKKRRKKEIKNYQLHNKKTFF